MSSVNLFIGNICLKIVDRTQMVYLYIQCCILVAKLQIDADSMLRIKEKCCMQWCVGV